MLLQESGAKLRGRDENSFVALLLLCCDGGRTYGILVRDQAMNIIANNTFVNTRDNALRLADASTAVVK